MVHIFSNQKSQFGYILEGIAMENVGIFNGPFVHFTYGQKVYFMAILYILCSFGIFFPVLVCCAEENLATLLKGHFHDLSTGYVTLLLFCCCGIQLNGGKW
jgi:hypothetical protein